MDRDNPGDLDHLVQLVFGQEPLPPRSIQLEIDNADSPHDVFQTLGQLLTHGIVYLYGQTASKHPDMDKLQQYLASVGWRAIVNPSSCKNYPRALPYLLSIPSNNSFIRVAFEPYTY